MWKQITNHYNEDSQTLEESLYMVGNGYLGVRGCFEEGYLDGETIRGSYLNGLYDRVPMVHAEMAYGFPTEQDKQPRILDTQTCEVWLDGERARLVNGQFDGYRRTLDFQSGESQRQYVFITTSGKRAQLMFKRLASFYQKNTLIYKIEVEYDGDIVLKSICDTDIENYSNPGDPRTGQGHNRLMTLGLLTYEDTNVYAQMQTKTSKLDQAVSIMHNVASLYPYALEHEKSGGKVITTIRGRNEIILEKRCVFTDGLRFTEPLEASKKISAASLALTYENYLHEQKKFLDEFWYNAAIVIEGCEEDQTAVRMMQFSLLQSIGTDAYSNVAAKGLSGEGYEGHYFWDTEIYIIPVLLMNQPEKAKKLLEYRYHILPSALMRARELGHQKGAAYAWRTISGIECSGYFPAGTAQYHINADIAYAFIQYYLYTKDLAFIIEMGAEVIFETARLWLEIGNFHNGQFHINDVTGPDEYTAIVNNNYYTNAMAKYHLDWAFKFYHILGTVEDETLKTRIHALISRIDVSPEEITMMRQASDGMIFSYDAQLKLYAQDDSFLSKPVWPFETADPEKKPLLLHYHPLHIYRHQVLKQADTLLAHMLLEHYATDSDIENAYHYYEKLTTHDSSLSSCIYGIMASRTGQSEKAYDYFMESIGLDLHDTHKNTKDGLHMANMGGTILSITAGFAGLRISETGLSFKPQKPAHWSSYSFKLRFQGRLIAIHVGETTSFELLEGEPITVKVWDENVLLQNESLKIKGVVFDLDGVLTETSKAHFEAWRELGHSLGFEVPHKLEDEVRGISRMDSLEIVLSYGDTAETKFGSRFTEAEKVALATRKNELYLERIKQYSPADLAPGTIELLQDLKSRGLKIALASASNNAPFLLKAMGIESFFDAVVDPQKVKSGKPAPDIFMLACEMIGLKPGACIGVEDAFAGIESIKAAGMQAIGIGSKTHLTNCEVVVSSLVSVGEIIKSRFL